MTCSDMYRSSLCEMWSSRRRLDGWSAALCAEGIQWTHTHAGGMQTNMLRLLSCLRGQETIVVTQDEVHLSSVNLLLGKVA